MITIQSNEPYVARGVTWLTYTIIEDGFDVQDDASTEDVIAVLQARQENFEQS